MPPLRLLRLLRLLLQMAVLAVLLLRVQALTWQEEEEAAEAEAEAPSPVRLLPMTGQAVGRLERRGVA